MPDASGQYQLQDYQVELNARGFDGLTPAEQIELVNRGYRRIARKTRWLWEQGSMTFTLAAGAPYYDLSALTTFGSLKRLYVTSAGQEKKVPLIDEERFFQYLSANPLNPSNWGEPGGYRVFDRRLYVFPIPSSSRDFLAYITRKVAKLVAATDVPITPPEYDDVVMNSTLVYAHERVHEWDEAGALKAELAEFFEDAMDDEVFEDEEEQERVRPDNQWL